MGFEISNKFTASGAAGVAREEVFELLELKELGTAERHRISSRARDVGVSDGRATTEFNYFARTGGHGEI